MRTLLITAFTALVSLTAAAPAAAGDPETCSYRESRLASECYNRRPIQRFLLEPVNAGVERYMDIPPAVRGWEPGEEEAVVRQINTLTHQRAVGCYYPKTPVLALACEYDPQARARLAQTNPGPDAIWFHLPPEIGGYPGSRFNNALLHRNPGADRQRVEWGMDVANRRTRAATLGRTLSRAMGGAEIQIIKAHLIAVDGQNFIACGYAASDGGGYEDMSMGTFIFDTRTPGANVFRATAEQFRARCLAADIVLQ